MHDMGAWEEGSHRGRTQMFKAVSGNRRALFLPLMCTTNSVEALKSKSRCKEDNINSSIHWRQAVKMSTVLWCAADDEGASIDPATPHYNSWILSDLTIQDQQCQIADTLGDSRSLRDGIILLKVWLHQRQLDVVCSLDTAYQSLNVPSVLVPSVLWCCWLGGRKSIRPVQNEWWGAGMVICLERGANDLNAVKILCTFY